MVILKFETTVDSVLLITPGCFIHLLNIKPQRIKKEQDAGKIKPTIPG